MKKLWDLRIEYLINFMKRYIVSIQNSNYEFHPWNHLCRSRVFMYLLSLSSLQSDWGLGMGDEIPRSEWHYPRNHHDRDGTYIRLSGLSIRCI